MVGRQVGRVIGWIIRVPSLWQGRTARCNRAVSVHRIDGVLKGDVV